MITIKNEKIATFYEQHPNINVEDVNLFLIQLIENIMQDEQKSISETITTSLLREISKKIDKMENSHNILNQNLSSTLNMVNTIQNKFSEQQQNLNHEISTIMENNNYKFNDKILSTMESSFSNLIDKNKILLSDIIPKENEDLYIKLSKIISDKYTNIYDIINKDNKSNIITDINVIFNNVFTDIKSSITTEIFTYISQQNNSILDEMKEQSENYSKINDFLEKQKYINSSDIGKFGENRLESILNELFPDSDIENTSAVGKCGDFFLNRTYHKNKRIMIENKEYSRNVPDSEIKKFIRDVENVDCHSIFLSQTSGIANKKHFEINFHNDNILVYIHNVQYNPDIIYLSVKLIDILAEKTENTSENTDIHLPKQILDCIQQDFINFSQQKNLLIDNAKTHYQKTISLIDNLELPSLSKFLSSYFSSVELKSAHICNFCNMTFKNKRSLGSHYKGCKSKNAEIIVET